METVAIIPARSGSKRIKDKNIKPFLGKPLFFWSIEYALKFNEIDKVVFATDSQKYIDMCFKEFGDKVTIVKRTQDTSRDDTRDTETFRHILSELKISSWDYDPYKSPIIIHLRPTFPIRKIETLKKGLEIMYNDGYKNKEAVLSVRTVVETDICIPKYYYRWSDLDDLGHSDIIFPATYKTKFFCSKEPENCPGHILPKFLKHNGNIDITRSDIIFHYDRMNCDVCTYGLIDDYDIDIDTEEDFIEAQKLGAKILNDNKSCERKP